MLAILPRLALLTFAVSHASALFIGAKDTSASSTSSAAAPQATTLSPLGSATDVFREGGTCRASWIPDTSGADTWKSTTIDLMTGSNLQMTRLGTVASGIDGTNPDVTSFNYSCPDVSPNAAIYFLQYTHDDGKDPAWTTRFAIADPNGKTVAPSNANQPQGGSPAVPWGEGALVAATNASSSSSTSTAAMSATRAAHAAVTGNARQSQLADVFSSYNQGKGSSTTYSADSASASHALGWLIVPAALAAVAFTSIL